MRLAAWIEQTAGFLECAGIDGGRRDARLLASAGCGLSMGQILAESERCLSADDIVRLDAMRARRLRREPVSRIVGRRGFMDLDLEITPATLDPRPDTETLVEAVLDTLTREQRSNAPLALVDLGTGSGAILLALLHQLPAAQGLGVDISAQALQVARRNADRCGLGPRTTWLQGSWLQGIDRKFDVIVSNPPYIPHGDIGGLDPEVALHDPHIALDGGEDGLDAFRMIASQAGSCLKPGGWLFLEFGDGQADAVAGVLHHCAAFRPAMELPSSIGPRMARDLAGRLRCVAVKHHATDELSKKMIGNSSETR